MNSISVSCLPLSQNAKLIFYADDILLFKPVDSALDVSLFQQDIDQVLSWITSNGLTPNHTNSSASPHHSFT